MDEGPNRRAYERRKCQIAANVLLNRQQSVVCYIQNISNGGACFTATLTELPKEFKLVMPGYNGVIRNCKAVWQRGLQFGVQFSSGPQL